MGTKRTGDVSEVTVILKVLKRGWNPLEPVGDRLPYDLVIEHGGKFVRIQVKTAWYKEHVDNYVVDSRLTKTNRKVMKRSKYPKGAFDFVIAYIQEKDVCYVIPLKEFNTWAGEVHFVEAEKRQRKPRSAQYREAWNLIEDMLNAGGS